MNENLPPINKQRYSQQQFNKAGGGRSNNPLADVESKVEKSLVHVLEQKYQDAIQLLDKAELKKDRAVFECEMAKKEKQQFVDIANQTKQELSSLRSTQEELEHQKHQLSVKVNQVTSESQKLQGQVEQVLKQCEHFKGQYFAEQKAREQDYQSAQNRQKELEEQLGEYEEENMNLQNNIYEQKVVIEKTRGISAIGAANKKAAVNLEDSLDLGS